jgi:hypothetical protein
MSSFPLPSSYHTRPLPGQASPQRGTIEITGEFSSPAPAPQFRYLTLFERVLQGLNHSHDFGRPSQSAGITYPKLYQSHQACLGCGMMRFYDARSMQPGPAFVAMNVSQSQRA